MVEDVADAFGDEPEIGGFAPDEEVEGDVEEVEAVVVGVEVAVAVGDLDIGLGSEVGAPGGVVSEEGGAEGAEDGGVELVDGVGGRGEAHLGVGEVEEEVLPLVADAVVLEAEEEGEPIEEVHVGVPLRGEAEVADGAEGGDGGADFGVAEGGVVGEAAVEGDDVVGFVAVRHEEKEEREDNTIAFGNEWDRNAETEERERERESEKTALIVWLITSYILHGLVLCCSRCVTVTAGTVRGKEEMARVS